MALSVSELLSNARAGDRRSLARLLTVVERGGPDGHATSASVFGDATGWVLGITGAPGAGKSTLTGALVSEMRKTIESVAVIAVDPSSPFSGGAILGDRVRMQAHTLDEGVYIRSMATRGHLGGLTVSVPESIRLLQACGYHDAIIETVGVGQVEVDIAAEADTTVVVVNPGWGDAVQANKAGLMEIADVFVVNKADRAGTENTVRDLENMLAVSGDREWTPPIVRCVAVEAQGISEFWDAVNAHRAHVAGTPALHAKQTARLEREMQRIVASLIRQKADDMFASENGQQLRHALVERTIDPWAAATQLLGES